MILYKYFNEKKGEKFFQDLLLNFTPPKFFNDPFEVTATYPVPTDAERVKQRKKYTDEIFRSNYNILSLTRSPLNKLMWSHYTNDHKGYVVGIDVNQNVLTNLNTCTIPVQFGSVIYTETKPNTYIFTGATDINNRYDFPKYTLEHSEFIQRLFLYKSIDWAYEEEVRIVKMFGNIGLHPGKDSEIFKEKEEHFVNENERHYLKLPNKSVKEIYMGINNKYYEDVSNFKKNYLQKSLNENQSTKIFKCVIDEFTWELKREASDQSVRPD